MSLSYLETRRKLCDNSKRRRKRKILITLLQKLRSEFGTNKPSTVKRGSLMINFGRRKNLVTEKEPVKTATSNSQSK